MLTFYCIEKEIKQLTNFEIFVERQTSLQRISTSQTLQIHLISKFSKVKLPTLVVKIIIQNIKDIQCILN